MTTGSVPAAPINDDPQFERAWRALREDGDIQFAPVEMPKQQEPPDWLVRLMEWLGEAMEPFWRALGASWPVLKWVLLGALVLAAALLIWRLLVPLLKIRPGNSADSYTEWTPDQAAALALLEDADQLAAEGRFDEATHLLLQRSVGQIAAARPDWVEPSSTAREIAALPALPEGARAAFRVIAERVERSLFALRSLSQDDWQAARAAYADFALARKAIAT